jgi:hypothetical protein
VGFGQEGKRIHFYITSRRAHGFMLGGIIFLFINNLAIYAGVGLIAEKLKLYPTIYWIMITIAIVDYLLLVKMKGGE